MQAVQFNPKIYLDYQDVLKGLSELPVSDLEQLVGELNQVIEQRRRFSCKTDATIYQIGERNYKRRGTN